MFFLTFQAGALNTIAFQACGRFVSHLTGYASFAGEALILSHWDRAVSYLAIPAAFFLGSFISSCFIELKVRAKNGIPRYDLLLIILSSLLVISLIASFFDLYGPFGSSLVKEDFLFLAPLAVACGIQNGLFSVRRGVVIRTTHLTGPTTDLAVNVVRLIGRVNKSSYDEKVERRLVFLRFCSIFFFILGATAATLIAAHFQYWALGLPIANSFIVLAYTLKFMSKRVREEEAVSRLQKIS